MNKTCFKKGHTPWNKLPEINLKCSGCNEDFTMKSCRFNKPTKLGKFCSKECFYEHRRSLRREVKCEFCDKNFKTNRKGIVKYCSFPCYSETKKGIFPKHLKEILEKDGPWNKGKKIPQTSGENNHNYGTKWEGDRLEKLKVSCKNSKEWCRGKTMDEIYGKEKAREIKTAIGIKNKEHRKYQIFPKKDSSIEVKIQSFLKQLGIEFFTHQYMKEIEHGYQCDILIPRMNLVIECDGDYWHKYPISRDIDNIRTGELIDKGFNVLRLWENEIRLMGIQEFENKLKVFYI